MSCLVFKKARKRTRGQLRTWDDSTYMVMYLDRMVRLEAAKLHRVRHPELYADNMLFARGG